MKTELVENKIIFTIDSKIYNLDVVHKCFYWYGNNFSVDVDFIDNEYLKVTLKKFEEREEDNIDFIIDKVKRDLVDFKLRDTVTKETQNIRDLIIAKAFAYYDIEIEEQNINVSDPVGFDPSEI